MYFTLILENESGEQVNLSTTANQYMTSKIEGLNPPAGTVSTSSYAGTAKISIIREQPQKNLRFP